MGDRPDRQVTSIIDEVARAIEDALLGGVEPVAARNDDLRTAAAAAIAAYNRAAPLTISMNGQEFAAPQGTRRVEITTGAGGGGKGSVSYSASGGSGGAHK